MPSKQSLINKMNRQQSTINKKEKGGTEEGMAGGAEGRSDAEVKHLQFLNKYRGTREYAQAVLGCDQRSVELHTPFAHYVTSQMEGYDIGKYGEVLRRRDAATTGALRIAYVEMKDAFVTEWDAFSDAQKAAFA